MADTDWRARCLHAEQLLAKARGGIKLSAQRLAVLQLLGELKPGQWLGTDRLAAAVGVKWSHLRDMEALGLVVSRPAQDRVCNKSEWRLEHLVVPAAKE